MPAVKNTLIRCNDRRLTDLERRLEDLGYCLDILLKELQGQNLSLTPGAITKLREYAEPRLEKQKLQESLRSKYAGKPLQDVKAAARSSEGLTKHTLWDLLNEMREQYRQEHRRLTLPELQELQNHASSVERKEIAKLIREKKKANARLLAEEKERFRQDHLAWTVPKLEEALPGANPVEQGVIRNLICQKKGFFRAEVKNWTLSKIKKCEVKEDWQKEILGEELANRKKKAEAKQAQQARCQTMTAKEVLASSQSADARALNKRLTQHGPEGTLAYLLFSAYKASSRAKVYRGSVKTNRGKLSYRGLSYSRKGNVLKKLAQFLCEHSSLVLGWGWGIDPEGWFQNILYIDLPEGQVSFHSRERYGGRDYTSQWDGQQKSEERILAFCDRKLNEPLASPP